MHWVSLNPIALAIDRASGMTRHITGLAARMGAGVPTLTNVYYIAHCQA